MAWLLLQGRLGPMVDRTGKVGPSFVRVGTIRDMSAVAAKLSMVRSAIQQIKESEDVMMDEGTSDRDWKEAVSLTVKAAEKGKDWCEDTIELLNKIKRNSEAYLRSL
jgi:hypothetical protein